MSHRKPLVLLTTRVPADEDEEIKAYQKQRGLLAKAQAQRDLFRRGLNDFCKEIGVTNPAISAK